MGQPSTSAQVRAVALREAVASCPVIDSKGPHPLVMDELEGQEEYILARAERFANYIENGVEQDA